MKRLMKIVTAAALTVTTAGMLSVPVGASTQNILQTVLNAPVQWADWDRNGDGAVTVADAVLLEKWLNAGAESSDEDAELVETVDWSHPGYFENPNDGVVYKFYKIYHVEPDHDFSKEYGHKPTAGVVCYPLEDGLENGEKPEYVQTFEGLESGKSMFNGLFIYEGEDLNYSVSYPYNDYGRGLHVREHLVRMIVHFETITIWDIADYDYNQNFAIDIGDVIIFNKIIWNSPWLWVTNEEYDYESNKDYKRQAANEFQGKLAFKVDWNEQDEDGGYWIRYGE